MVNFILVELVKELFGGFLIYCQAIWWKSPLGEASPPAGGWGGRGEGATNRASGYAGFHKDAYSSGGANISTQAELATSMKVNDVTPAHFL